MRISTNLRRLVRLKAKRKRLDRRIMQLAWYTVRYARKQQKPVTIFWPDGSTT